MHALLAYRVYLDMYANESGCDGRAISVTVPWCEATRREKRIRRELVKVKPDICRELVFTRDAERVTYVFHCFVRCCFTIHRYLIRAPLYHSCTDSGGDTIGVSRERYSPKAQCPKHACRFRARNRVCIYIDDNQNEPKKQATLKTETARP